MATVLLADAHWLDAIGRSLREGFFMFWETLWPLILGFALSGVVQAFVSHEAMQRKLGDHRPRAVVRASGYGMVSSSCSYAASAMSKSLFVKGADFVASLVFMVASTNLVIELGIVLIVLMGWQFAASEFVGGVIMIVLLASLGGFWFRGKAGRRSPARLIDESTRAPATTHVHAPPENTALQAESWRTKLRSKGGWADAATYTMSDLTMLRRELVIGYVVAGFLTVLVPTSVWNAVFLHGHGFWTSLENVIVGPFIAIISFVCSIGNVPLAAALWKGGISFGGVVSFIFADLITLPLLLIYRRFYGTRLMLRMLALLWAVMSVAGLLTEGIFRAAGLIPAHTPDPDRTRRFLMELHDVSQHHLPGGVRRPLLGVPQPRTPRRWERDCPRPGLRHAGDDRHRTRIARPRRKPLLLLLRPLQRALRGSTGSLRRRDRPEGRPPDTVRTHV